jgi:hypothetical protein
VNSSSPTCSKLPEHLKAYWKKWEENVNERNSIKINQETYDRIAATLGQHSASKSIPTIPPAQPTSIRRQITAGLRPDPVANEVDRWHVSMLLTNHSAMQSAVQFTFGESAGPRAQLSEVASGKKRALPDDIVDQPIVKHSRKPRTCHRCHRADCDGRFNRRPCNFRP